MTAEFHPVEGAGHLVWSAADGEQIIGWMSDFLYRYVAPQPAVDDDAQPSEAGASDDGGPNRWLIAAAGIAAVAVLTAGVLFARRRGRSY